MIGIVNERIELTNDFASTINSIEESEKLKDLFEKIDVSFEAVGGA
ncbi:MAG: hypothetical protein QXT26_07360 [Thermoproteota archaeon]